VPFTGEAGCNTGNWHESLNMAAVWQLPVIFVLENNHYGVSTNIEETTKIKDLSQRAHAYGIPGFRVDGFDVLAVYESAMQAVDRARRGEGPTLIVTESYRLDGHYAGEPEVYREKSEVESYRRMDPIPRFRNHLLTKKQADAKALDKIDAEVDDEITEAIEFARQSPDPDPTTATDYIYA
jgi:TPP-dependent pyruvate/acetoin dehydrogenase alpha subunit